MDLQRNISLFLSLPPFRESFKNLGFPCQVKIPQSDCLRKSFFSLLPSLLLRSSIMDQEGKRKEEPTLEAARSSVFKQSEDLDEARFLKVSGYDFNSGLDFFELFNSFSATGFQASNLGDAIAIVNQMLSHEDPGEENTRCKIFLGFTSNLISSGVRESIRFLVEHKMVDVVVTTAGGIEEDLIKCLAPTYKGDFAFSGSYLRSKGLNRIGNLLVPNNNYCKFEDWVMPIFDQMLLEQKTQNVVWTPSKMIERLGKEINDPGSYLYWASKNKIPVFCPALTDGSLGDMLGFHSIRNPGLTIDIVEDVTKIYSEAENASPRKTGMILLGGGLPKHHICSANAMCDGADFAVYINTGQEFDGSDSGARPDEAISWGKIKASAKHVKVHCDATIAFPLLVAVTFANRVEETDFKDTIQRVLRKTEQKEPGIEFNGPGSSISKQSVDLERMNLVKVEGYDFNQGVDLANLLRSFSSTGFQASNLGDAIDVVNQMISWRLSHEEVSFDCPEEERDLAFRERVKCKIFLGVTSNLISSGVRDTIRFLVEHRLVDVLVTTAGGVSEDLIKCISSTYRGDFSLPGDYLHSKGLRQIGNLLVSNNYPSFEQWILPSLDQMLEEQISEGILWSPSKIAACLGKKINNPSSYLFWASKNNIPVFCPALTDGTLGDVLYSHSQRSDHRLVIDIVHDIKAIYSEAVRAGPRKTGMIILGGGLSKHHVCNANMMRNGADFAVYINTGEEFDGSDSGARPDEAVSWGKIRGSAQPVKVHCDATIAFPLLVAATFAKSVERRP